MAASNLARQKRTLLGWNRSSEARSGHADLSAHYFWELGGTNP